MSVSNVGGAGLPQQATKIQDDAAAGNFSVPEDGQNESAYYLKLMAQMQAEQRAYQAFVEVLSSRHNAAMAAIRKTGGG